MCDFIIGTVRKSSEFKIVIELGVLHNGQGHLHMDVLARGMRHAIDSKWVLLAVHFFISTFFYWLLDITHDFIWIPDDPMWSCDPKVEEHWPDTAYCHVTLNVTKVVNNNDYMISNSYWTSVRQMLRYSLVYAVNKGLLLLYIKPTLCM